MIDTKAKILSFLSQFFRDLDLRNDEDIFSLGFVNSLFAMQLVQFVESEFTITVEQEDIDIENFKSINAIAALVERKTSSSIEGK